MPCRWSAISKLPLSFGPFLTGPELPSTDKQEMKMIMRNRAKNPGPGRARISALALLFLCLLPTLLSAQGPTPDTLAAAAGGDAKAQFALGDYYFRSRFVTLDYAQVLTWYRKSAAQRLCSGAESARQNV